MNGEAAEFSCQVDVLQLAVLPVGGGVHVEGEALLLQLLQQRIQSQDPALLLKRGYSITLKDGKSVRSASQLKSGDIIEMKFAEGSVKAEVMNNL